MGGYSGVPFSLPHRPRAIFRRAATSTDNLDRPERPVRKARQALTVSSKLAAGFNVALYRLGSKPVHGSGTEPASRGPGRSTPARTPPRPFYTVPDAGTTLAMAKFAAPLSAATMPATRATTAFRRTEPVMERAGWATESQSADDSASECQHSGGGGPESPQGRAINGCGTGSERWVEASTAYTSPRTGPLLPRRRK